MGSGYDLTVPPYSSRSWSASMYSRRSLGSLMKTMRSRVCSSNQADGGRQCLGTFGDDDDDDDDDDDGDEGADASDALLHLHHVHA